MSEAKHTAKQAILNAQASVEVAQARVKAAEQAAVSAFCPVKVGDIIDGSVSMSGTPCKLVVTGISVLLGNGRFIFHAAGDKLKLNGEPCLNISAYAHISESYADEIDGALDQFNNADARRGF